MKYSETTTESQAQGEPKSKRPTPGKVGLGLSLAVAGFAVGTFAYAWFATHPPRRKPRRKRDEVLPIEEVTFASRDGLKLHGWFAPAENGRGGVILCHGHTANRLDGIRVARSLHAAGFHVLLFDFRASGESEGRLCTIGGEEINDLLGAADFLTGLPVMEGLSLGVFGVSMGGAVSLMVAAEDERFAAVATHGAYANLERAIQQYSRMFLGPFGAALAEPSKKWGRLWMEREPEDVSPLKVIHRIAPRPVLLLHGGRDFTVNKADVHDLYAAAGSPKSMHILPRSWHYSVHPSERAEFYRLITAFFQSNL